MREQQPLFGQTAPQTAAGGDPSMRPAGARATDPETSHAAAEEIETSGSAEAQRNAVFELVSAHPGCTSDELAAFSKHLDRWQVARRLPELRDKYALVTTRGGTKRESTVTGRTGLCWWPTGKGEH